MSSQKRRYEMKARAESLLLTRQRITESAVELHGTLGPSQTTMSAVADRAGVRRSPLYRHFPDEAALLEACSGHWTVQHPPPDIAGWATLRDPAERLRTALLELYAYYDSAEPMLANIVRDLDLVEGLRGPFAKFGEYLQAGSNVLMAGRRGRGRTTRRAQVALGHAMAFTTWRSLVRDQGCTPEEAVDLMCRLP